MKNLVDENRCMFAVYRDFEMFQNYAKRLTAEQIKQKNGLDGIEDLSVFVYYDCDAAKAMIRSTVKLGGKYYLTDGEGSLLSEGYDTMCPITARKESAAMPENFDKPPIRTCTAPGMLVGESGGLGVIGLDGQQLVCCEYCKIKPFSFNEILLNEGERHAYYAGSADMYLAYYNNMDDEEDYFITDSCYAYSAADGAIVFADIYGLSPCTVTEQFGFLEEDSIIYSDFPKERRTEKLYVSYRPEDEMPNDVTETASLFTEDSEVESQIGYIKPHGVIVLLDEVSFKIYSEEEGLQSLISNMLEAGTKFFAADEVERLTRKIVSGDDKIHRLELPYVTWRRLCIHFGNDVTVGEIRKLSSEELEKTVGKAGAIEVRECLRWVIIEE